MRTAYRYLQHWMLHPYLWRYLKGGKLRSWGAKTLGESGRRGEPHLAGDGYARIGEGSGSTNVLTGSGVDEAWTTGTQLAESVLELLKANKPFTKENLEGTYVQRRRASWVEAEGRVAEKSRDGFQKGVVRGMMGMALAGMTNGRFTLAGEPVQPYKRIPSLEEYYRGRIPLAEIERLRQECAAKGTSLHATLMERVGWPAIPYDGQLLVSQQDALLLGGKVQAPPGYADHVVFLYPEPLRTVRHENLHRSLFRPGHHARRTAACRRSTARNVSTAAPAIGTARNRRRMIRNSMNIAFRRRHWRIALGGKLRTHFWAAAHDESRQRLVRPACRRYWRERKQSSPCTLPSSLLVLGFNQSGSKLHALQTLRDVQRLPATRPRTTPSPVKWYARQSWLLLCARIESLTILSASPSNT